MATGRGRSLGAALVDLYRQTSGPRTSYRATGWHAQLRELTGTKVGTSALNATGLSPSRRTLVAWLAETQRPTRANEEKIRQAYASMKGGTAPGSGGRFNRAAVARELKISGRVTFTGSNGRKDSRVRGVGGTSPLLVDGEAGDWSEIEREWNKGERRPDVHDSLFLEGVLEPDFGEVSEGAWGSAFDGDWYEIEV